MVNLKNKIICMILSIPLLMFGILGMVSLSKSIYVKNDNVIAEVVSESEAVAKLVNGDTITYYSDVNEAINNASRDSIVILMQDNTSISSYRGKAFTIDINGKEVDWNTTNYTMNITIKDSVGTGKIKGSRSLSFYANSRVTVESGTIAINLNITDNSSLTVKGGELSAVYAIKNNLEVLGGQINRLVVYEIGYIHLSGGKIKSFAFPGGSANFSFIEEGYAYKNLNTNDFVKVSDMTTDTPVEIVKCIHTKFVDSVCEYCGYVCNHTGHYNHESVCEVCGYVCNHEGHFNHEGVCEECGYICNHEGHFNSESVCEVCGYICNHEGHYNAEGICEVCGYECNHEGHFNHEGVCEECGYICNHEGHYNAEGICEVCGYECNHEGYFNHEGVCERCGHICQHTELNENNNCIKCGNEIEVNVSNDLSSKNYIKLTDAVDLIENGDTVKLYRNIILSSGISFNAMCTIDLNGYEIGGYYASLDNKIVVIDTVGNGSIAISSSSTNSEIQLKGSETTIYVIMLASNRVKIYSGRIYYLNIYNGPISNILLDNYIFIKHNDSTTEKMTKEESSKSSFGVEGEYLTVEQCVHDAVNDEFECIYCGKNLSTEESISALVNQLEKAKTDLELAISQKEDINIVNEKVATLNEAILNVENKSKEYTDTQYTELKAELENNIAEAKRDVISYADTVLEQAKIQLMNMINEKIDTETYNENINQLNNAIRNAEIASKAYTDEKDVILKTELETKIAESKTALEEVSNAIIERLNNAENKINDNSKGIKVLKISLIVSICALVTAIATGFALMFMYAKKIMSKIK